jgi:hypothetical protein
LKFPVKMRSQIPISRSCQECAEPGLLVMDDSVFSLRTGALTGAFATLTLPTASIAGAITMT